MSASPSSSPAVASLHDEQARQRTGDTSLDEALKETFPASDPVSQASSTTATSSHENDEAPEDEAAPKVDEALAAVKARYGSSDREYSLEEISAMRAEVKSMLESAQELASASGQMAKHEARSLRDNLASRVREHPLPALGLAVLAGYLWGLGR